MKRSVVITLAIAAVILLLLFVLLGGSGSKKNFNWKETYDSKSKEPYGTFIIHEMLKDYFPNNKLTNIKSNVVSELPIDEESDEVKNYIFVGEGMFMKTEEINHILKFVSKGNNAFIASKSLPYDMSFLLYYQECYDYENGEQIYWNDYDSFEDTLVKPNLKHNQLRQNRLRYVFENDYITQEYRWHYIPNEYFCENDMGFTSLGTLSDSRVGEYNYFSMINYAEEGDKGGQVYLLTTPIMLTNYFLTNKSKLDFASKWFSHLEEGDIYWDDYSRVTEEFSRRANQFRSNNREDMTLSSESPLKYILQDRYLSAAWYTLVGMAILYLMFRAKRRQRIIPVMKQNANTSLEFISTIGALYYNKKNNRNLCEQKMKMFKYFMFQRYGITVSHTLSDKFIKKAAKLSGVPEQKYQDLAKLYKNIISGVYITDNTTIHFHQLLEDIYKNCK